MSIFLFEKNESRTPSSSRPRIKMSFLTKREFQIGEYWPSSFFLFLFFCVFIYGTITTVLISLSLVSRFALVSRSARNIAFAPLGS